MVAVARVVAAAAVVRVVAGEDGILLPFRLYSQKKAKKCPLCYLYNSWETKCVFTHDVPTPSPSRQKSGRAEKPLIGCRFRGSLWSPLTILQRIK